MRNLTILSFRQCIDPLMSRIPRVARPPVDGFVLALLAVVLTATFLPCRGNTTGGFHAAGIGAIAALFFLQGRN